MDPEYDDLDYYPPDPGRPPHAVVLPTIPLRLAVVIVAAVAGLAWGTARVADALRAAPPAPPAGPAAARHFTPGMDP